MKGSMTSGNPLKLILQFSLPLLLGNLFQQTYNMVDAAIVGQVLGSDALAAVGASSSVQFLVLGFCIGTCAGFAIPVAQRFGAEDYPGMRRYVFNGSVLSTVTAVILTLVTALLCTQILTALQVPQEIFARAYDYLLVILLGIPFCILYNYLSGILRAIGDSKTPFYFLALSATLNIALDFFCIVNLQMGVRGAAVATVISQAVSGLLCLLLIARKFALLHLKKEDCVMEGAVTKNLLVMGVPMGLQYSITAIGSMVMQSANNGLGTVYVSGFTAGMKIKQFMMCPFDAIATAVSTFASQNYGAMKADRIKKGIVQGTEVGVLYGIVAGIVMILFGRQMSLLFVPADSVLVLDAAQKYLTRMGMFWWSLGFLNVLRMSTQGLGFAGRAVAAGAVEMVCRVVVSLFFVPKFGFDAITFADQSAWIGACLYIVPICLLTVRSITKKLEIESQFN